MPVAAKAAVVKMAGCAAGIPDDMRVAVMAAVMVMAVLMGLVASIAMMAPVVIPAVALAGQRRRADGQ